MPDSIPPPSETISIVENPGSTILNADGKREHVAQSKSDLPPAKKAARPVEGTGDERLGNI